MLAEFLLLPPGTTDDGSDPRVRGSSSLREAVVDVGAGTMDVTVVYDTDVYAREWSIGLPEGATLRGVSTPWGPVRASTVSGAAKFELPYPSGYGLGARAFTLSLDLAPAEPHGGAFFKLEASVPAAQDDEVRIEFRVPAGATPTGLRASEGATVSGLVATATGPVAASLAYLGPVADGRARFTVEPWVIDVPAPLAGTARATAEKAASLLPEALSFAGGDRITRPFFVAYTDEPVFDWEEGFYSPGLNTISIRAQELRNVTDGGAHLKPVQVLVHETAHGLLDRLVQSGPADLSLFQEGLARLAETKVELRMADEVFECHEVDRRQSCVRHSSRLDAQRLQEHYRAGGSFDAGWLVRETPAEHRGFLYDYSGMVLHAYERASPEGALEAALSDLAAAPGPGEPRLAAVRLVDALLLQSPTLSREAFLHPGREAASLPLDEFRACLGPLVAPGFPFDPAPRVPAGGCPAAPAPTQAERDGLTRAPTTPLPPVTAPTTPASSTPRIVPVSPGGPVGPSGSVPGGVMESPVEIPFGAWLTLAAAAVAVAVVRRR